MLPVLSREQMRQFDAHAITSCGVPSILLMENAGRNAADCVERDLARGAGSVTLLCGPGNNGGDGFVVARQLVTRGHGVRVFLAGARGRLSGDCALNRAAFEGIGGTVTELPSGSTPEFEAALEHGGLVVDALFGTGLDRELEPPARGLIEAMNRVPARRIALDIPSGLDANTGRVLGVAFRAHRTVTFAHPKLGLLTTSGAEYAGQIDVVDIGVPPELYLHVGHAAELVETRDVATLIRPRRAGTHKGSAGRVLAFAGSAGKTGAALLVARGALRAGAGLVTIVTFPDAAEALDRRVLEEMTARIDPARSAESVRALLEGASSVAIGPGFGLDAAARSVVDEVVLGWDGVKIVDADALTHFRGRAAEIARAPGRAILTPHPAELGRLLDLSADEVEADRFEAARRAAELTGAVVVLKGPRSLIAAPGQLPRVNRSGSPVLATGGAGDVLTGITAAFACQLEPRDAAVAAVFVHGLAAERWAAERGADRGLLAHEIADALPAALAGLAKQQG